jgi:hypothetical protein
MLCCNIPLWTQEIYGCFDGREEECDKSECRVLASRMGHKETEPHYEEICVSKWRLTENPAWHFEICALAVHF